MAVTCFLPDVMSQSPNRTESDFSPRARDLDCLLARVGEGGERGGIRPTFLVNRETAKVRFTTRQETLSLHFTAYMDGGCCWALYCGTARHQLCGEAKSQPDFNNFPARRYRSYEPREGALAVNSCKYDESNNAG